jgi:hypothetical protein
MPRSELSLQWSIFIIASACVLLPLLPNGAVSQETVTIENVPGHGIDANWYRYLNARFGVGVDIPATGFAYELSANGDGVTLTSTDGEKTIAVYGSQDIDLSGADSDPLAAFATLAEEQIDAMRLGAVNIVHDRIEPQWFELSTTDAEYLYYQKGLLSLNCPAFTTNLWIKYPNTAAKEFDSVVQRMSNSLVGNCSTVE